MQEKHHSYMEKFMNTCVCLKQNDHDYIRVKFDPKEKKSQ